MGVFSLTILALIAAKCMSCILLSEPNSFAVNIVNGSIFDPIR